MAFFKTHTICAFFAAGLFSLNAANAESTSNKDVFEIITTHCNDVLFDSDGGGVSACIEANYRYNEWQFGYGLYGVTPELKNGGITGDNLEDLARFTVGLGQLKQTPWGDYSYQGRIGLEGGLIDDIAGDLQKAVHNLFGVGFRNLVKTHKTRFIGGVAGWARVNAFVHNDNRLAIKLQPYIHASIGLDTVEAGGGFLLAFQPNSATKSLGLLLPKNGSYLATFGGDGFGIFGAARVVARETLYSGPTDNMRKPVVVEFGTVAQYTAFDKVKLGWSASCTSKAYKGVPKADCKTEARIGYVFSGL